MENEKITQEQIDRAMKKFKGKVKKLKLAGGLKGPSTTRTHQIDPIGQGGRSVKELDPARKRRGKRNAPRMYL